MKARIRIEDDLEDLEEGATVDMDSAIYRCSGKYLERTAYTTETKRCGCAYVIAVDGQRLAKPARINRCPTHLRASTERGLRKQRARRDARP